MVFFFCFVFTFELYLPENVKLYISREDYINLFSWSIKRFIIKFFYHLNLDTDVCEIYGRYLNNKILTYFKFKTEVSLSEQR